MNAIAVGIPGLLALLAVLMWLRPRLRRHRSVRRFRKDLHHVEVMTVVWTHSLQDNGPFADELWNHRPKRRRNRHHDGDVPA